MPVSHSQMREIVLGPNETPKKVDNFLKRQFPIGYVRKLFRKNGVRVNGLRAREDDVIHAGDRVQLYVPFEPAMSPAVPSGRGPSIETVFEDEILLVINKPAGMAVHEGKTVNKRESVLGILESRYRAADIKLILVHRLDKDTSGLLMIAKNQQTAESLRSSFESGEVGKQYICLVVGRLREHEGKIDFPLPGREGKPVRALTRFRVIKRFSETTLVGVQIETGRLHQIRLHFAKLGYPVVMDDQHGDFAFNKRFRKQYGLKRQFLHAEKLRVKHSGKQRDWTAPLAKDLKDTLRQMDNRPRALR
jgi:23S rRNA pseudouridine955/2504/2580 synthase